MLSVSILLAATPSTSHNWYEQMRKVLRSAAHKILSDIAILIYRQLQQFIVRQVLLQCKVPAALYPDIIHLHLEWVTPTCHDVQCLSPFCITGVSVWAVIALFDLNYGLTLYISLSCMSDKYKNDTVIEKADDGTL